MNVQTIKILVIFFTLLPSFADAGSWADRRSKLENVAIYGKFRVFYSMSGIEKLPQARRHDLNAKHVPKFIDSIGKRLIAADNFFKYDVNLVPPLNSKRYRGKAQYIDINVLNFSNHKKGPKNGVAYDGTPKFNRRKSGKASARVLAIDLSSNLNLNTHTVEHELFHLYQNGYTYFKNRWYTEGTARWSELIMKNRIGQNQALPKTMAEKNALFKKSYSANSFWNELMLTVDKKNQGKVFIKRLLEQLSVVDDIAAKQHGIAGNRWKESEQKSRKNNHYIWRAAIDVAQQLRHSSKVDKLKLL